MHKNLTVNGAKHLKLLLGSSEWVIQGGIIHEAVIQWVIQMDHSGRVIQGGHRMEVLLLK